jgi:hypothetical protein
MTTFYLTGEWEELFPIRKVQERLLTVSFAAPEGRPEI